MREGSARSASRASSPATATRGRRPAAELLERLRSAPEGRAGALESEARRGAVLGLVAALKPIVAQIAELTSQIAGAVRAHPDGQVFLPLFKDPKSAITAARLVAEIGDDRARYPSGEALAADAGMAPVARESGKRKVACLSLGLRQAAARGGFLPCRLDTPPPSVGSRASTPEPAPAGSTTRTRSAFLGRAWLRVLWRCWQDEVPYDPAKHGNLRRLQPAGG